MEIVRLKTKDLLSNTGQIEGLPSNPRQWTNDDIDRIASSLKDTPELFEARPCLVYPQGDKYIILGGNLRFEGAKRNKMKDVPCIVFPEETPADKLKEIVIKDNGAFGAWDMDALANEWDDLPLVDWGCPAWDAGKDAGVNVSPDDFGEDFELPDGDKEPFQQMTFTLADFQAQEIKDAIEDAKHLEEYKTMITYGNSNSNGNAIAYIVEQWIESRK